MDTILTALDLDPYCQYGSGSRGAISIRIHMDPDSKHCLQHKAKLNLTFSDAWAQIVTNYKTILKIM